MKHAEQGFTNILLSRSTLETGSISQEFRWRDYITDNFDVG